MKTRCCSSVRLNLVTADFSIDSDHLIDLHFRSYLLIKMEEGPHSRSNLVMFPSHSLVWFVNAEFFSLLVPMKDKKAYENA